MLERSGGEHLGFPVGKRGVGRGKDLGLGKGKRRIWILRRRTGLPVLLAGSEEKQDGKKAGLAEKRTHYSGESYGARLREVLGVPKGVGVLCVIALGYPAEQKRPRTQYDDARVHCERW